MESDSIHAAEGTALIFYAYEMVGISGFIWFVCRRTTARNDGVWMICLALGILLAITIMRGKRLEMVIAIMPMILILWSTKLRSIKSRISLLLLIVAILSFMASLRLGQFPDVSDLIFHIFSEGLYAGHVTPGIINALDLKNIEYEGGARFLASLVAFVPRFIFPGKDQFIYESLTNISQFAPLGATSILAEVYLQYGAIAVLIFFGVLGYIAKKFEIGTLGISETTLPVKSILYIIFLCSFIPHFRDGIIPSIKIPIQLLIMFSVLFIMASGRLVKIKRPINQN